MREIFVSHATADVHLAEALVDFLMDAIGVKSKGIFCSSLEGFGNPLTYDFNVNMRDQISDPKLVLLLMTPSYMESKFCLMELGAVWTRSLRALPIVVPPVTFEDVNKTIGNVQGWNITNRQGLQTLRKTVIDALGIEGQEQHIFDKKRDRWTDALPNLLSRLSPPTRVDRGVHEATDARREQVERQLVDAQASVAQLERKLAAAAPLLPRVLIVEDEPLIAQDIEELLERSGFEVVSIARTASEAIAAFSRHRPNIITVDIQLADGSSGIDAVNNMLADRAAAVTFVTAFPERLLTAERPVPVHLITKPFNPDLLIETIWKSYNEFLGAPVSKTQS